MFQVFGHSLKGIFKILVSSYIQSVYVYEYIYTHTRRCLRVYLHFYIYMYLSSICLSVCLPTYLPSVCLGRSIPLNGLNYVPQFVAQFHRRCLRGGDVSCTRVCIFSNVMNTCQATSHNKNSAYNKLHLVKCPPPQALFPAHSNPVTRNLPLYLLSFLSVGT